MYNCIIHIDVFYYVLDVRIFFLVQISIKCILYILLYFFISNKPIFFFLVIFYHFFTCLNGIRPIWVIGFTCNLHCCFAQVKLIATILCHTSRPSSFFPFISQFIAIIVVIFFFFYHYQRKSHSHSIPSLYSPSTMSKTPKPTNTISAIASFNAQASIHFENHNLQISTLKLNGKNFIEWSYFIKKLL